MVGIHELVDYNVFKNDTISFNELLIKKDQVKKNHHSLNYGLGWVNMYFWEDIRNYKRACTY